MLKKTIPALLLLLILTLSPSGKAIAAGSYQLVAKSYRHQDIEIRYPQITNWIDRKKQDAINEIIRKDVLQVLDSIEKGTSVTLEIDYQVMLQTDNILSIKYLGYLEVYGAAHPSNLFYTTNLDLKQGVKLSLKDLVTLDARFIQRLKNGQYRPWHPQLNLESDGDLDWVMNDFYDQEHLLEALNNYHIFCYLTTDALGISLPLPHAIGDHIEFEINYQELIPNLKATNPVWGDYLGLVPPVKHTPLIKQNEKALFSFKVNKSNKILTIAVATAEPEYILYRFGTKERIELEFPNETGASWKKFSYSYYFRGGGPGNAGLDLNYLTFINNGITYTVYQESSSETDSIAIGVKVKDRQNREFDIKGDPASMLGSLIDLRFEDRIEIKELE